MNTRSREPAKDVQGQTIPKENVVATVGDIIPHGRRGKEKRFICWPEDSGLGNIGSLTFISRAWSPDTEGTPLPGKGSFVVLSKFERRPDGWTAHAARNLRLDEDDSP